jgi:hypothetical protein
MIIVIVFSIDMVTAKKLVMVTISECVSFCIFRKHDASDLHSDKYYLQYVLVVTLYVPYNVQFFISGVPLMLSACCQRQFTALTVTAMATILSS